MGLFKCDWCERDNWIDISSTDHGFLCFTCNEEVKKAVEVIKDRREIPKRERLAQELAKTLPEEILIHPNKEWERIDRARVIVDPRLKGGGSDPDTAPQCPCGYYHYGMC